MFDERPLNPAEIAALHESPKPAPKAAAKGKKKADDRKSNETHASFVAGPPIADAVGTQSEGGGLWSTETHADCAAAAFKANNLTGHEKYATHGASAGQVHKQRRGHWPFETQRKRAASLQPQQRSKPDA